MATTATILGAIAAAGAVGSAGAGIAGASRGTPSARSTKVPLSPYTQALQRLSARYLATNINAQPPSFDQYVKSGGTATFGTPVGLNPTEEAGLGIVGKYGNAVPFFDPTTGKITMGPALTPEQSMFLAQAYQEMRRPLAARRTRQAEKKREKASSSKKSGGSS